MKTNCLGTVILLGVIARSITRRRGVGTAAVVQPALLP